MKKPWVQQKVWTSSVYEIASQKGKGTSINNQGNRGGVFQF